MMLTKSSKLVVKFGNIAIVSLIFGLASCTQAPAPTQTEGREDSSQTEASQRPQVVATSTVLCDLTQQIAQDTIDLTCLMQPGQDPHIYEPRPSDRRAIEDADLVLYGGYGFEPDLIQIINATQTSVPKVAVYEEAVPEPIMGDAHDHDHNGQSDHKDAATGADHDHDHAEATADHDHDHEHEHADTTTANDRLDDHDHDTVDSVADPHIWHDAQNGVRMVDVIQTQLAQIMPDQANIYAQHADVLSNDLNQLDSWIKAQVATVPADARKLVTTHDSFRYFAQAYDFEVEGALSGLSTDEKPSASRMTELVSLIKAANVKAIFPESTTNSQLIEALARDANVTVAEQALYVEGPGGDESSAPTYQTMLVSNTCTIVTALGGQCSQSDAPI
ncbi:MAG: metal ABC transporter solute-binding protein, Zn/Mn family [Elainellaceae cyanobacterium]